MKKLIDGHQCPCCNIFLQGEYEGTQTTYKCNYGEDVSYNLFKFICQNSGKNIAMLETLFSNTKLFWETKNEDILDRYKTKENYKSKYKDNALFYAYSPIIQNKDNIINLITQAVDSMQKEGYKTTLVVPKKLKNELINEKLEHRFITIWELEDKFFNMCYGTKYGSLLAELNIINESIKWKNCKLFSIYPTVLKTFTYIGEEIKDWQKLEQMLSAN